MITDIAAFIGGVTTKYDAFLKGEGLSPEDVVLLYQNFGAIAGYLTSQDALNVIVYGKGYFKESIEAFELIEQDLMPLAIAAQYAIDFKALPADKQEHIRRISNAHNN